MKKLLLAILILGLLSCEQAQQLAPEYPLEFTNETELGFQFVGVYLDNEFAYSIEHNQFNNGYQLPEDVAHGTVVSLYIRHWSMGNMEIPIFLSGEFTRATRVYLVHFDSETWGIRFEYNLE